MGVALLIALEHRHFSSDRLCVERITGGSVAPISIVVKMSTANAISQHAIANRAGETGSNGWAATIKAHQRFEHGKTTRSIRSR